MGMSLAQLEEQVARHAQLAALPDMSHEERVRVLAEQRATVDRLAAQEQHALDEANQSDQETIKTLGRLARRHHSAQSFFHRLEAAIAKAEKTEHTKRPQAECLWQPSTKKTPSRKRTIPS